MKQHEEWIIKAEHDLLSAKKLISGDDKIPDTAIYHTQQCAEKSLKAYLSFHNKPIEKTHDLQMLMELCIEFDQDIDALYDNVITLSPYAALYRYPGPVIEPDIADVDDAINTAENLFSYVYNKLFNK